MSKVRKTCIDCGGAAYVAPGAIDFLSSNMLAVFRDRFGGDSELSSAIVPALCDRCNAAQIETATATLIEEAGSASRDARIRRVGLPETVPHADALHPLMTAFVEDRLKIPGTEDRRTGLYIHGRTGVGKTSMAVNMVRRWVQMGHGATYRTEVVMFSNLRRFRETEGNQSAADAEMDLLRSTPLLVIDDFGTQTATEFVASSTYDIIDARYRNQNLRTLIVSNASLQALEDSPEFKQVDARIARRIRDLCVVVDMDTLPTKLANRQRKRAQGAA